MCFKIQFRVTLLLTNLFLHLLRFYDKPILYYEIFILINILSLSSVSDIIKSKIEIIYWTINFEFKIFERIILVLVLLYHLK